MSKKKNNSKIICDVASCNYNNEEEGKCTLENVCISCQCNKDECCDNSSTICQSFTSSGGIITDNEYEVVSELEEKEV